MTTWQWVGFNIFLEIFPLLGNSFLVGKNTHTKKNTVLLTLNLSSIFYSKTKVIAFIQLSFYLWQANERRQVTTLTLSPEISLLDSWVPLEYLLFFTLLQAMVLPKFHYYIIRALFSLPSNNFFSLNHRISPIESLQILGCHCPIP